jgi:hypothetical protein
MTQPSIHFKHIQCDKIKWWVIEKKGGLEFIEQTGVEFLEVFGPRFNYTGLK